MSNPSTVHTLFELQPYLCLLTAFNFHQQNRRCILHSICYAFSSTLIIVSIPVIIVLAIWYLIENGVELIEFVAALPILISVLQMELTFIALMWKNRRIIETTIRLQEIVDQSESFSSNFAPGRYAIFLRIS